MQRDGGIRRSSRGRAAGVRPDRCRQMSARWEACCERRLLFGASIEHHWTIHRELSKRLAPGTTFRAPSMAKPSERNSAANTRTHSQPAAVLRSTWALILVLRAASLADGC